MHPLPKNFSKKRIYDGKTMVRDIRKYNRFKESEDYAAAMSLPRNFTTNLECTLTLASI